MDSPEASRTIQQSLDSPEKTQGETSSTQLTQETKPELKLPEGISEHDLVEKKDMLKEPEEKDQVILVHPETHQEFKASSGLNRGVWPQGPNVDLTNALETKEGHYLVYRSKSGEILAMIPAVAKGGAIAEAELIEMEEREKALEGIREKIAREKIERNLGGNVFTGVYEIARQQDPTLPEWNPSWESVSDISDPDIRKKIVNTFQTLPRNVDDWERGRPGTGRRNSEFTSGIDIGNLPNFDYLYQKMIASPKNIFGERYTPNPNAKNLSALSPKEREAFLRELPNVDLEAGKPIVVDDLDLNTIIDAIIGASAGRTYPGGDLQVMLAADKQMGLGGELVRKRVEQLMVVEEYDDTKQMRQGGFESIMGALGQFLTQDPALQQELRVFMFARYKLHESTILGRYVGVDKLAQQMSNFYQDEFRMIMDVKLFKEAATLLDSDDGAYFREGEGFGRKDMRQLEQDRKAKRYEKDTLQKALLLTPDLADKAYVKDADLSDKDRIKRNAEELPQYCGFSREGLVEIARRLVERANLTGNFNSDQATLENIAEEVAGQKPDLKINLSLKGELSVLFKESLLAKSKFSYEDVAKIFEEKIQLDKDTDKATPIVTVVDSLLSKGMDKGGLAAFTNTADKQRMIDLLSDSFRAFGLSIKVFDIFGRSAEHTGLINNQGYYMRPKPVGEELRSMETKLRLPNDMSWFNLVSNDYFKKMVANNVGGIKSEWESLHPGLNFNDLSDLSKDDKYKVVDDYIKAHRGNDAKGPKDVAEFMKKYVSKWQKNDIDLKKLDIADDATAEQRAEHEEKIAVLDVIRDLEGIAIRDAQARVNREFVVAEWDNIDKDTTNPFRQGAREYRKAMWNQILLTGLNKDTKGKEFLRRFASTDVISLIQNNGRKSVLDQMTHWNDDFQNMKKHSDALITGAQLRTALTDKEPGLFNSTTKLNDPVEHLRAIKDILVEWTQTHRNEYLDFISSAVLVYLAEYNAADNPGYRNAGIMRIMGLAQEMFDGSVISKGAKGKVEDQLYGSRYRAEALYAYFKAHKRQAFFGLIKDIFTASVKDLFH